MYRISFFDSYGLCSIDVEGHENMILELSNLRNSDVWDIDVIELEGYE